MAALSETVYKDERIDQRVEDLSCAIFVCCYDGYIDKKSLQKPKMQFISYRNPAKPMYVLARSFLCGVAVCTKKCYSSLM